MRPYSERTAELSPDGIYRYTLTRRWRAGPRLAWIMLNPSKADGEIDDATIRLCVGFSDRAGFGAIVVANLYALRATDPLELGRHPDPIGPRNDAVLDELVSDEEQEIVVAWGDGGRGRAELIMGGPLALTSVLCLGTTRSGQPRHPRGVAKSQRFESYLITLGNVGR